MTVIFLGPPGVGKGTQGERLAEACHWTRIATGDLLREARQEGTELGRKAEAYMDRGELVPDELIVDLVRDEVASLPLERGIVFDGFPRNTAQAEALDGVLAETRRHVDRVILLEAPDEVLVQRIAGRRSCPGCGRVHNVHFDPPESEGACDECGADLEHRSDDAPETVRRRLEVYRDETEPLVEFYRAHRAPLVRVRGDREVDEVHGAVRAAVGGQHEVPDTGRDGLRG